MLRKIMAGILIGISAIMLGLSIAGIVLVWIYKEPLTREAITRLKAVDTELAQAQTALQNAQTELERTLRVVKMAEKTLATLKDDLAQAKELFGAVNGTLDEQLIPSLKATREKVLQAKSTLQDLRTSLEQINSLPFINLNLPGDALLVSWIEIADSIEAQITQVEDLTQKASTFMSDMSYLSGGDLSETKQGLENFLVVVNEYDQKLAGWRAQVAGLIQSLPGWVETASVSLTVFLLWFGFSQLSLILHGLRAWHGGDPLARWRKAVDEDIQI
jgi:hypothetical protein